MKFDVFMKKTKQGYYVYSATINGILCKIMYDCMPRISLVRADLIERYYGKN